MSEEIDKKGQRSIDLDRSARSGQQLRNLKGKIKLQKPKIERLRELTKEHESEAMIVIIDPKEKKLIGLAALKFQVRNQGEFIQDRRRIADRYNLRGKR